MVDEGRSPQVTVWITIRGGGLDPEACTRAVGITPDRVWLQPPYLVKDGKQEVEWCIGFRRKDFDAISDAITSVVNRVWPLRGKILQFVKANEYTLTTVCNVTIWDDRPSYFIPSDLMRKLAELECDFILDIFDYRDRDETENIT